MVLLYGVVVCVVLCVLLYMRVVHVECIVLVVEKNEVLMQPLCRYPAGFQVNIIPANLATWVPGDWNVIHIVHTPPVQARNITVMIAPIGASVLS